MRLETKGTIQDSPGGFYLLEFHNGNTSPTCKICSKLKEKTAEQRQRRYSGVFFVNLEQIFTHCSGVANVAFEQANTD